ncbi:MAG: DUF4037 domain-containing protein [Spirochaetaceae bacterium]|jgi:hypothetical protein|nr:DUF4037 domain-containing protein [Spirochaetaceae bacterium]
MKYKTKMLADRFAKIFSQWPGVVCVALNEAALPDTLDPYFALILDVYYTGNIPESAERFAQFGADAVAFETSSTGTKDRFLVGEIPVRIEYKFTSRIDELVSIAAARHEKIWLIKDSGTYGFYRLATGELLFSRNTWINGIREQLKNLDDEFWSQIREASQSKMEHFLSDLGAAFIQGDDFYYLMSAAGFIKSACLTLFSINRTFEPSHRAYYNQVLKLKELPESFAAQLETFLRNDTAISMERKYNLAQLMARGIVSL